MVRLVVRWARGSEGLWTASHACEITRVSGRGGAADCFTCMCDDVGQWRGGAADCITCM